MTPEKKEIKTFTLFFFLTFTHSAILVTDLLCKRYLRKIFICKNLCLKYMSSKKQITHSIKKQYKLSTFKMNVEKEASGYM